MNHPPSDGIAYTGGRYLPLAEASIPMTDRGFVRSDATYDVAHVHQGRFFRLDDHIERFFWSMSQLRMSLPLDAAAVREILLQCVARSGLREAYVQMTCTRGVPPPGSRDPRACTNRFHAFCQPFVWIATPQQQEAGIAMVVSRVQRIPAASVDTRVKNFHWLDLTMGIFDAYDRGALVAVLVDGQGQVTEGAGFNVFAVAGGQLHTPRHNVFEGMTRRTVLELAPHLGLQARVGPVSVAALQAADEVFITSTAGGVMPVTRLDGHAVGSGRPGPVTRAVQSAYWQRAASDPRCTAVDYTAFEAGACA
ncbi:MAG: aminotransferase class IV [Aquincola tertiaricarbonis]